MKKWSTGISVCTGRLSRYSPLGGTMTHHHGVGLTLRGFMRDEFGESFETLQASSTSSIRITS